MELYNLTLMPENAKSRNYTHRISVTYREPLQLKLGPVSALNVSIQNLTHITLPRSVKEDQIPFVKDCIDPKAIMNDDKLKNYWDKMKEGYLHFEGISTENKLAIWDIYCKNFSKPCVVINLDNIRKNFIKYLGEDLIYKSHKNGKGNFNFLDKKVNGKNFEEIFGNYLLISEKKIDDIADKVGGFEGKVVLFHTGWNQFLPQFEDWDHPVWVCWHLLHLYPFLDFVSACSLLKHGVVGLGIDTISIECPLYYTNKQYRLKDLNSIINNIKDGRIKYLILPYIENDNLGSLLPVHCVLLFGRGPIDGSPFFIISNMNFDLSSDEEKDFYEEFVQGTLFVFPFKTFSREEKVRGRMWSGIPCLTFLVT